MHVLTAPYAFDSRRSSRSFFLPRTAQQVESGRRARELARAAAALLSLVSWGGLLLLVAG
jgi:hypothetical protein